MKKRFILFILFWGIVSCSTNNEPISEPQELQVMSVWGRPLPAAVENGAFYMHIMNKTDTADQLLGADIGLCEKVELHTMTMDENGVMRMHPIEESEAIIAADDDLLLQPGGIHVMCLGKTQALEVGDSVPLTLTFAQAGEVVVTAEIRDEIVTDSDMDHMSH